LYIYTHKQLDISYNKDRVGVVVTHSEGGAEARACVCVYVCVCVCVCMGGRQQAIPVHLLDPSQSTYSRGSTAADGAACRCDWVLLWSAQVVSPAAEED
jgi:hypothetical protein